MFIYCEMDWSHLWLAALALCSVIPLVLAKKTMFPNLALHQPTKQSSTRTGGFSYKAVDGNTNGDLERGLSCSHTIENPTDYPWWMVDLGKKYMISTLMLSNRVDCCWERLQSVEIRIGDIEDPKFHSSIVCATNLMLMEPKTHAVDCSRSTLGRFVYVRLLHKTPLTLCEVQVFPEYAPSLYPPSFLVLHNSIYKEATLEILHFNTGTVSVKVDTGEIFVSNLRDLYANFPVRWGALVVGDAVLAQFTKDLVTMKPLFEGGQIIGQDGQFRFKVQSNSNTHFVKYAVFSELRHKDVCKLRTECPPNSECSTKFLSEKFLPTTYMCQCKKGFQSSTRRVAAFVLPGTPERCIGESIAVGKPTNQSDTLYDAESARAVDGNSDFHFTDKSCSSTTEHSKAWWRVDLVKIEPVSEVFIQFRRECCDNEATELRVTVGPYKKDTRYPLLGDMKVNDVCSQFMLSEISDDKGWHAHCGKTIFGRYVYIRSLGKKRLILCEVHVYREPTVNIAVDMSDYGAAVDGNVLTCYYSNPFLEPWWELDLHYVRPIALVQIRAGVSFKSKVEVIIGMQKSDKAQVCNSSSGTLKKDEFVEYSCNRPDRWKGRYVFITIPDKEARLSLCEVNIYAVFEINLSQGKHALQSSVAVEEFDPQMALDGDKETCAITDEQKDPWWRVSLGRTENVSEVLIYLLDTQLSLIVLVDDQFCGEVTHAVDGQPIPVICTPKAHGRTVTVMSKGEDRVLSLCEVEIYGEIRDDDECQAKEACPSDRVCKNLVGSYQCACKPGTAATPGTKDRFKPLCQDVNECVEDPCGDTSTCVNSVGSYSCLCNDGYKKNGSKCEDVDECQLPNRCDSHSLCVNSPGSYMCVCLAGYTGDSRNRSCQDLDECATDMNSCGQNAVCINTFSSFSCKCREGWFGDGRMCFDVNECQFDNACPEHSDCQNLPGTFECLCHRGFRKSSKGSCVFDVPDPRKPSVHQCGLGKKDCIPHVKCFVMKVFYRCKCEETDVPGNKQKCVDTDECSRGLISFNDRAKCINVLRSYDCVCGGDGYSGHRPSCADLERCDPDHQSSRCSSFATCVKIPDSYLCFCNEGYLRQGALCDVC